MSSSTSLSRRGEPYLDGELETMLQTAPTRSNIAHLAKLLGRSTQAIQIVFRQAYGFGDFGRSARSQRAKIRDARRRVGISL